MPEYSNRLRELRESRGLTQLDIANALGFKADASYRQYELGRHKPGYDLLIKLAMFYNVSVDYIIGLSDDPTRH